MESMSDFKTAWQLSRKRFVDAVSDLDGAALNWRLHPESLTIGEMAIHVAGVEVSFISQLLDAPLDELPARLRSAATDGVVNDRPFPFSVEEITPDMVRRALEVAQSMVEPVIGHPSEAVRQKEIVSALGPTITGEGAFARLAFHPAYHQGQVHLLRTAPGFPKSS
jgi:hypothetical protein